MKKKQKKYDFKPYPPEDGSRSGCKVAWNYYRKLEDAQACSRAAIHNAEIKWELGYDFGYCSPGSIRKVEEEQRYTGMYEVCLP